MKRIDANYELYKIKSKSKLSNKKSIKNIFIPLFVFVFSIVALFGVSYSNKLFNDNEFTININIVNGYEDKYYNIVDGGYFEDYIVSPNSNVKSLVCESGNLLYDDNNFKIFSDNVSEDINCILEFEFNIPDGISTNYLDTTYDNFGISYLFNKDLNNYIVYNDMLFRIIRINGDGSLRIMLNDSIGKYTNNDINYVLDDWFNGLVNKDYVVYNSFDNFNLDNFDKVLVNYDEYNISNVGLLSVNELLLYGIDYDNTMLSNKYYDNYWGLLAYNIQAIDANFSLDVRPVINIQVNVLEGNGTEELPYKIVK